MLRLIEVLPPELPPLCPVLLYCCAILLPPNAGPIDVTLDAVAAGPFSFNSFSTRCNSARICSFWIICSSLVAPPV